MKSDKKRYKELLKKVVKNHESAVKAAKSLDPVKDIIMLVCLYKIPETKLDIENIKNDLPLVNHAFVDCKLITYGKYGNTGKLTLNHIYKTLKDHKDIQLFLDCAAENIRTHLESWGFTLLKDMEMTMIKKK